MTVAITKARFRVGEPIRNRSLTVFPLFSEPNGQVEYDLADEAMRNKTLVVEEVSDSGSVPELTVENRGDRRVLFIEGEELLGAKQNRILNLTVLVPAGVKVTIPVSCIERGRWAFKSRTFGSGGRHSHSKLRHVLKSSVARSAAAGGGHRSDQSAVWREVAAFNAMHYVKSPTDAISDAYEALASDVDEIRRQIQYVDGAVGAAVAVGKNIVAVDVFDKPETCRKVWNRLLSGVTMDSLAAEDAEPSAEAADVEALLAQVESANWQPTPPVGEGQEYRADIDTDQASALMFEDTLIHGSLVRAM